MLASFQMELLSQQRGYLLLSGRTQMFIIGIIYGLLGVHLAQFGQRIDHVYVGPGSKALTQAYQEGILGETQGCRGREACSQLTHIRDIGCIYLTDVRHDQNVGTTHLRFAVGEELRQSLQENGIVVLPIALHENGIFYQ